MDAGEGADGPVPSPTDGSPYDQPLLDASGDAPAPAIDFGNGGDGADSAPSSPVDALSNHEAAVDASADGLARVMLAGGGAHTCARTVARTVACWGRNTYGELGMDGGDRLTPTTVPGLSDVIAVAAGGGGGSGLSGHTCALTVPGTVFCWGANDWGQLGDGTTAIVSAPGRAEPRAVAGLTGVVEVTAGIHHTCARKDDGTVWCWGRGDMGQLGIGKLVSVATPTPALNLSDAVQVVAGAYHTCTRRASGAVACWGRNAYGEAGTGDFFVAPTPVTVAGLPPAAFLAAGSSTTCVVVADGSALCWGDDEYGQLGDGAGGPQILSATPVPVPGLEQVARIGLAGASGCALLASGKVKCWGSNGVGQLGRTDMQRALTPVEVPGLDQVVDLVVGSANTAFAVRDDGTIWSWGGNGNGQLGDGSQKDRWQPTLVSPLPTM